MRDILDNELSINIRRNDIILESIVVNEFGDISNYLKDLPDDKKDELFGKNSISSNGELFYVPTLGKNIKYSKFRSDYTYMDSIMINSYNKPFPVLEINIPYDYYSKQTIPDNIFIWDEELGNYLFTPFDIIGIRKLFSRICREGINMPLFFQISRGKLISASNETYLILLMALYLKLPTIPVILFLVDSDEDINSNFKELNRKPINNAILDEDEFNIINKSCNKYFIFYNPKFNDKKPELIGEYNKIERKDKTIDYWRLIDKPTTISNNKIYTNEDINNLHKQLQEEVSNKIKEDIDNYLDNQL